MMRMVTVICTCKILSICTCYELGDIMLQTKFAIASGHAARKRKRTSCSQCMAGLLVVGHPLPHGHILQPAAADGPRMYIHW